MADSSSASAQKDKGWEALKSYISSHKIDFSLGCTRVLTMLFTLAYFIPLFGNPYGAYYKTLLANAATSAIRLHQRLPPPQVSKDFVILLFSEDSAHYLLYSLIFLYVSPVALVLLPVFLFSLLHFSSYSLNLLDILGQNSWWGARLFISLVEFQSRNILRSIAFTEILLMPMIVLTLFMGRAGLLTPLVYYHFLTLRYASRRNPHTRQMFSDMRVKVESVVNRSSVPQFIRDVVLFTINIISKLAPQPQAASQ